MMQMHPQPPRLNPVDSAAALPTHTLACPTPRPLTCNARDLAVAADAIIIVVRCRCTTPATTAACNTTATACGKQETLILGFCFPEKSSSNKIKWSGQVLLDVHSYQHKYCQSAGCSIAAKRCNTLGAQTAACILQCFR